MCVAKIAVVRAPSEESTESGLSVSVAGSMSAKTGRRPFHDTACAVAANVNDGSTTSPVSSAHRSTSISPEVQEETATT